MTPHERRYTLEVYYFLWSLHRIAPRVADVVTATGLPRGMVWAWLWRMGLIP
jgi:hypothetical protein